ncbi:MAG: AI-2E family transporter [Jaaginema sp. PMC 1079.18]|nr:AI-2E family transporter [Jaaginema sp. PMC 1080.18]MEC4852477.1 AI-2E family transporter [Jaaginema sp. PMC 1079.18]MEC4868636.1 AI-2E family transporter [Jaaginema sp. PMC 1078.18]
MSQQRITISFSTVLTIGAAGLAVLLLWQLRGLAIALMIAVVLAATLAPIVQQAERFNVPRWLAVLLVYAGLISVFVGLGLWLGPPVFGQIQRLVRRFPSYLEILQLLAQDLLLRFGLTEPELLNQIDRVFNLQGLTSWIFQSSQELLIRSFGVTRGLLGAVFNSILALLLSIYMLNGADDILEGIVSLFPQPWKDRIIAAIPTVSARMGAYIRGRVLVSLILSVAVSIGLRFLGIADFALGLGAIAGVTNLIPFFGPALGLIPALIVAIAQGGLTFLWVFLLFVIIQNLETYILDPLLVGSTVRVAPLYQLLAVLGGAQVLGIVGALIVPPWVAGAAVLLENLYLKPKREAETYRQSFQDNADITANPLNPETAKPQS